MGCQCFNYLSVSLKCFKGEFPLCTEIVVFTHLYLFFVLNTLQNFKYDIGKTCISYPFYSPARPSCLILFYLVSDVGPAAVEVKPANEAVEPSLEREWQPNDVMLEQECR